MVTLFDTPVLTPERLVLRDPGAAVPSPDEPCLVFRHTGKAR